MVNFKNEDMLTMPFLRTIPTHKWLMPLPLQPWSKYGLICSEWSALEMLHSLHLVQQYRPPTESNIKKIFKNYIHVFINVTTKHEFVIYWLFNPLYLVCCILIIVSVIYFIAIQFFFYFLTYFGTSVTKIHIYRYTDKHNFTVLLFFQRFTLNSRVREICKASSQGIMVFTLISQVF